MLLRAVLLTCVVVLAPGCLVVSLHPAYDEDSLTWDPALLGTWQSTDDETLLQIAQDEWRSYRIHYKHPIEAGELTGYLTSIGDERFMDVMPSRGQDRGAFVIPVHAIIRVRLAGERLELTPLSYDWFLDRSRKPGSIAGLGLTIDQKQNALVVSAPAALRAWLVKQPADGAMFGATTVFVKKG